MSTSPQMLTGEEPATRALGAVLHHDQEFTISWLRSIGLEADAIHSVEVEWIYQVELSDDEAGDQSRRADIRIVVGLPSGEAPGPGTTAVVIVEGKIDALVDEIQLDHARQAADWVVSLIPEGLPVSVNPNVVTATWEDLITLMAQTEREPLPFLAQQLLAVVRSLRVQRRRSLQAIVNGAALPPGWTLDAGVASSSGSSLAVITGPERGDHGVQIELANENYGRGSLPEARVLITSTRCPTDPVMIEALRDVDPPTDNSSLVAAYRTRGGKRTPDERRALEAAGVPKYRTYGFGTAQHLKYGWAGYGPFIDLTVEDYTKEQAEAWLSFVLDVAVAADAALTQALDRANSSP